MALITNFEQLRSVVKFISSSDPASGMIDTTAAEIRYLLPVLGPTLYDSLVAQVAADNVADGYVTLLALCRAVAATMSVYHNLALIQTNITDTGLKTSNTENFDAAHRWEYMEVKEQLIDRASLAQESLITYLITNATALSWTNPGYNGLIKSGAEFNDYFFISQPHRTFMMLRPFIREAETHLAFAVGKAYLASLKALAEPTVQELEALDYAKKFITNYAINKAIEKVSVQLTPQGFTVMLTAADQPADGRANGPDNQLSLLYNSTKLDAKKGLSDFKRYMNANASATVFADFFTSEFYIDPALRNRRDDNCRRKGVFSM